MPEPSHNEFEQAGQQREERGLVAEFWDFLRENKKFWLIPLVLALLLLGGLLLLTANPAAAPFIYTLF
jgi:hypothetical protein